MHTSRSAELFAGSALLALASAPALAQTTVDVAKITCEQYVTFKVTDPRNIGIWLSGYYHAKRGSTVVDIQQLEQNAQKVTDFCRANYPVPVMEAVEKALK
jgi:hypothetical protein